MPLPLRCGLELYYSLRSGQGRGRVARFAGRTPERSNRTGPFVALVQRTEMRPLYRTVERRRPGKTRNAYIRWGTRI